VNDRVPACSRRRKKEGGTGESLGLLGGFYKDLMEKKKRN